MTVRAPAFISSLKPFGRPLWFPKSLLVRAAELRAQLAGKFSTFPRRLSEAGPNKIVIIEPFLVTEPGPRAFAPPRPPL